jgi:tetratricopeptide (TPR) repeat protein
MKTLVLVLFLTLPAWGSADTRQNGSPSPAELRIAAAQKVLQKQPNRFQAYNDLALALVSRARETGDRSYYQQAQAAIESSLRIQPDNFEGGQAHVALLLAEHKYRQALDEAQALNHRMPDAVLTWGYMADAEAALGDYDKAEESAQWMMNLRPGNLPAYLTGAALRQDWGDIDGALDFFSKALQQTPPLETEETAWILTRMAQLQRQAGRLSPAEALLDQALKTFPDYYLAIEELAEVRLAQHRYPEAAELIDKPLQNIKSPSSQLLAARAWEGAGKAAEADKMYQAFERVARAQIALPDNANVQLVAYYVDHARQPQEALRIARLEMESRHDVWTLDAYAWALYANAQYAEAGRQIAKALAVGTRDAVLFYHAGTIEAASGKRAEAIRYFQQSLDLNPASEVSEAARRAVSQSGNITAVRYAH